MRHFTDHPHERPYRVGGRLAAEIEARFVEQHRQIKQLRRALEEQTALAERCADAMDEALVERTAARALMVAQQDELDTLRRDSTRSFTELDALRTSTARQRVEARRANDLRWNL